MMTEQAKTLEGLQTAIRMEIDGKEYYRKASKQSGNELGAKLLQRLAAEEDIHRQKFEKIYRSIQTQKNWPRVSLKADNGKTLRTIFAEAAGRIGTDVKVPDSELDTVQVALQMEVKSYDFYQGRSKTAAYPVEKEFYETVSGEERGHQLVLLDYYEFLKDPAAWFVRAEHPSLDGG